MPNWCYNTMSVSGPDKDIREFLTRYHGDAGPLSFNKILPLPEKLKDDGWYEWCSLHWGTKWDIETTAQSQCRIEVLPREIGFSFPTAWSPPIPVLAEAARNHPSLTLDVLYCEEGMGFAGRVVWKGGVAVQEEDYAHGTEGYNAAQNGQRTEDAGMDSAEESPGSPVEIARELLIGSKKKPSAVPEGQETPLPREVQLENLLQKMDGMKAMGERVAEETLRIAELSGFPLEMWSRNGFPAKAGDLWEIGRRDLEEAGGELVVAKIAARGKGAERAVGLHDRTFRRFQNEGGRILLRKRGFILRAKNGWAVVGGIAEDERGFVGVLGDGKFQNTVDGEAAGTEWGFCPQKRTIYKSGEVFCIGGKPWNPSPGTPALREWHPDGTPKLVGRFFDGKNSGAKGTPAVESYSLDGRLVGKKYSRTGRNRGEERGAAEGK